METKPITIIRVGSKRAEAIGVRPPCFSSHTDWVEWNRMRVLEMSIGACAPANHCTDCLAEFQAQMKREGRCEHPAVTFGLDADGKEAGFRPADIPWEVA